MTTLKWVTALASFILLSCTGSGDKQEDETHRRAPVVASAHTDSGTAAGTLHIDAEMLRDLRVTTAPAQARTAGENVTVLGELRVDEDAYAEVGSPITGRVTRLYVAPGDHVRTGQALIELQSVELGKARAEYLGARARSLLAHQALERKQGLAAEQITPERELQESQAEATAADATLRAARAALGALGVSERDIDAGDDADTARFILRSPIAGTVLERSAVRGQMSDPVRPLFRVGDLSRLWLTVHAFERDAIRVQAGVMTRIEFPALPGRFFSGSVAGVGREVNVSSRTIPIRIDVANTEGLLRPGMSATAWIPLGGARDSVLAVPATSLQRLAEGWCVFAPHGEGVFEIRPVGRGRDLGSDVEIVSGLRPGETIVIDGAFLLKAEADKARGETGEHED